MHTATLSEVLQAVRLRGAVFFDVEASALTTVIAMINLWNRLGVSVH